MFKKLHHTKKEFKMNKKNILPLLAMLLILSGIWAQSVYAQEKISQSDSTKQSEEVVFKTSSIILTNSVKSLHKKAWDASVSHIFGLVNDGIGQLYGLDEGANVRLGLDYGITNNLTVGINRISIRKIVTGRFKYTFLHQKGYNGFPVQLSMAGNVSISTAPNLFRGHYTTGDKLSYMYELMIARKFEPPTDLSLQVAPVFVHYNRVNYDEHNNYFGVALGGSYKISDHSSFMMEFIPIVDRNPGTDEIFSIGVNIETKKHLFQLFLTNAQNLNLQGMMRETTDKILDGDFRFGFSINRLL